MDKRSRQPNPPQQQQQPMMVQRASPGQRRSRNPLESAAQRRMTEADVRDAEVSAEAERIFGGKFNFEIDCS